MHITTAIAVSVITLIDYALWGTSKCNFAIPYPLRVLLPEGGRCGALTAPVVWPIRATVRPRPVAEATRRRSTPSDPPFPMRVVARRGRAAAKRNRTIASCLCYARSAMTLRSH